MRQARRAGRANAEVAQVTTGAPCRRAECACTGAGRANPEVTQGKLRQVHCACGWVYWYGCRPGKLERLRKGRLHFGALGPRVGLLQVLQYRHAELRGQAAGVVQAGRVHARDVGLHVHELGLVVQRRDPFVHHRE